MILSKVEQVRKDIKDNPLKTAKDKKRFKKQVLDNVDDYLNYILTDFGNMTDKLKKIEKVISKEFEKN
tara:strand:- start:188 stop:391 length:204 start_codon:yes stop_codon:yes gene_type:complete